MVYYNILQGYDELLNQPLALTDLQLKSHHFSICQHSREAKIDLRKTCFKLPATTRITTTATAAITSTTWVIPFISKITPTSTLCSRSTPTVTTFYLNKRSNLCLIWNWHLMINDNHKLRLSMKNKTIILDSRHRKFIKK